MSDGQRVDWRAIPTRYRAWQALPLWRKALWLVTRIVTVAVFYVLAAAVILWFNAPEPVEAIGAGEASILTLGGVFASQPELLLLLLVLVPAIAAAVVLPHKPDWR